MGGHVEATLDDGELERFERELLPLMDGAYTLARHLTGDAHDAQDVVQEAYLRALRYYGSFRGGNPRAWLLTIVRHCCYTWRRRDHGHPPVIEYDDDEHAPPTGPEYAADARLLEDDRRERLRRAVEDLPREFREVIVLREFEDLDYKEIARVTAAPIGTVMSRLARARRRLRLALAPADGEPD